MKAHLVGRAAQILHISDLHIRRSEIDSGQAVSEPIGNVAWRSLWTYQMMNELPWKDAVVCMVTGDLAWTSPDRKVYAAVKKELDSRFHAPNKAWLTVPGNHDRKQWGIFGKPDVISFEKEFGEEWNKPRWLRHIPIVFVPIDSNPTKKSRNKIRWAYDFARGSAGQEITRIRTSLEAVRREIIAAFHQDIEALSRNELLALCRNFKSAFDPEQISALDKGDIDVPMFNSLGNVLGRVLAELFFARAARCLLLHHHPIGIPGTEHARSPTSQDIYLAMVDAGTLLDEARKNGISVICHGHKHMSHRICVTLPGSGNEGIAIIGCGSTTATGGGEQSANVIQVTGSGCVSIKTYYYSAATWKELGSPLSARAWPEVRRQLGIAAEAQSHYSVRNVRCEYTILPSGDVVSTIEYDGINHKDKDSRGFALLPLGVISSTHPQPPSLASSKGVKDCDFIANKISEDAWLGFLKFRAVVGGDTPPVIAIQNIGHCAFAMNEWQFWGLYGYRSQRSKSKKEQLGLFCAWPISDRLEITVRLSEGARVSFGEIEPVSNLPGDVQDIDERRSMRWQASPSGKLFCAQMDTPRWGNFYGLDWQWPETEHLSVTTGAESIRRRLERAAEIVQDPNQPNDLPDLCVKLKRVLNSLTTDWSDLEATVYVLCRGDGESRAILRQIAWNDVLADTALQTLSLPFGIGVAGRAIWRLRAVPWIRSSSHDLEDRLADYYYKRHSGDGHTSVIAYPLSIAPDTYPIAVLSLSSRKYGRFFDLTKTQLPSASERERAEGRASLSSLSELRRKVQDIIKAA